MMKKIFIAVCAVIISTSCAAQVKQYNIVSYGAMANKLSTKAIQAAVDACNADGGGDVVVPAGVYFMGTVHLKSNIHLLLKSGAVLKGSINLNDYEPYKPDTPYAPIHLGMFFTKDAENISISGEGQVDGNCNKFFDLEKAKKLDSTITQYSRQGNNFRDVASGIGDGPVVPKDRPYQMFVFSNCRRVTVEDIFINDAPFWCMHFADCDAVKVDGIKLWNSMLVPNSDGIDINSCNNVIVTNCDICSGDDCFAITGFDHHFEVPGFEHLHHLSENIIVSNCNLQSSSSAIRIGYLDQNDVRNIQISNINITNSTRGIGIFLRDQGSLENITISNVYIETHLRTGDWWGNAEPIHISAVRGKSGVKLGHIRHVVFSNIVCKGENGILLYGSEESELKDIAFDHIRFEFTDSKLNDVAGGNVDLRGCLDIKQGLFKRDIPGFLAEYVDGLTIKDFQLTWDHPRMPWLTNGVEVNHFKNLVISDFRGTGAPVNNATHPVRLTDGENFKSDLGALDISLSDVK